MCVYLYIHNKYTQYTYTYCKQKLLFCMRLIAINHLTAYEVNKPVFIRSPFNIMRNH